MERPELPKVTPGGKTLAKLLDSAGAALLDVVFTCGLIAIMAAIAIPSLRTSHDRDAALLAARYLAGKLQHLRVEAIRRNRLVALRFDPRDPGRWATYVDGDGDGVLQHDIDRGIDEVLHGDEHVGGLFKSVSVGVPLSLPAPDGSGVINANDDPIRIGNTNLLSFSPLGTATSGTIYLSGSGSTQVCVRVLGTTGRVRVLRFDRAGETWRQE
jgi:Tfp pilus assembly protein FimT